MPRPIPTVIAIPARDEHDRIAACLEAVLVQRDCAGGLLSSPDLRIIVLANNCSDRTAKVAAAVDPGIEVISVDLPPEQATAGYARRLTMDLAAARLPEGEGLICTTDADSRPRPDWIVNLWAALDGGAEAVAGVVDLEPQQAYSAGRRLESVYSALQAELSARLDPEPHNPWPNHFWAWGANLAVTGAAYRLVGGLPPSPLAEDRAFVERLRRHDLPVRHCLKARVWTSARSSGRAPGGLAALIADHSGPDLAPCDALLEPALHAARRALLRRRFRLLRTHGGPVHAFARAVRMTPRDVAETAEAGTFGAAWDCIEQASPRLVRRRLKLEDLKREVRDARRLLAWIRPDGEADRSDSALAATAGPWSDFLAAP